MKYWHAMTLVAAFAAAPAVFADDKKKNDEVEEKIALDQLPAAVKKAAEEAVKGLVITEVEKVTKKDSQFYEVEGKAADGKEYEVKISPEGKVLKVEQEDEVDDDDDDNKKPTKK